MKHESKKYSPQSLRTFARTFGPAPGSTTVNYFALAKGIPSFSIPLRSAEKSLFRAVACLFDTVQLSVTGANVIAPLLAIVWA